MPKAESIVEGILGFLYYAGEMLPRPFETPYDHVKRLRRLEYKTYYDTVWRLKRHGLVSITDKNGQRFVKLTAKGQLKMLLAKARLAQSAGAWDGKWRIVMFDIPESSKKQRHVFRSLLKGERFYKLQASVYASPFPLNREAVKYLEQSRLIEYIRILRVDEMDNDRALRKHFGL